MKSAWLFLAAVPLLAQNGVTPAWDVTTNAASLAASVQKIQPILASLKPADWVAKGAPEAYAQQAKNAQTAIGHLVNSVNQLAREPERLTVGLDVLFRMQAMEQLLMSVREGVRKYQAPSVADQLARSMADYSNLKEQLQQHVTDLATAREEEFKIADREAQRCRSELTRQVPAEPRQQQRRNRKQE